MSKHIIDLRTFQRETHGGLHCRNLHLTEVLHGEFVRQLLIALVVHSVHRLDFFLVWMVVAVPEVSETGLLGRVEVLGSHTVTITSCHSQQLIGAATFIGQ